MILVTGGAGFIGSNFVHLWRRLERREPVLVLDLLTYAADPGRIEGLEGVTLVRGDIRDGALVRRLLERHGIRAIVHFAAESHVDNSISGPDAFVTTNVNGTCALLEAARLAWAGDPDTRFLHVSTDEVYGSLGEAGRFSETSPCRPNSPYSASKAASDHFVRAYHRTYGLPTLTTHCTNNYGPRQHSEKLIPLAIGRMARKEPVPIYGDGSNVRDWIFVEDHCTALVRVLEQGRPGEVYGIGAGEEWRNLDLLKRLGAEVDRALGRPEGTSEGLFAFVEDRAGHDLRYAMDAGRLRRELGWAPVVPFQAGLARTVAWYLAREREA